MTARADQNPCTDNACDPKGGCIFPANALPCDDKNPCTGGDKCGNGKCQPGAGAPCDDGNPCTDQGCDTAKGGCYFTSNTTNCEDGNACTAGDKCANGKCGKGGTVVCDDKNGCTADSCDVVKGCVYQQAGACDDGDPCTADSCNPANGACSHAAVANCCGKAVHLEVLLCERARPLRQVLALRRGEPTVRPEAIQRRDRCSQCPTTPKPGRAMAIPYRALEELPERMRLGERGRLQRPQPAHRSTPDDEPG
ncbi:MAG: hypothetical protein FJ100_22350 [Deltaproteobacteria bacterium]|nr:hypothetical protein [Deltaproteobacteria bacterium]